MIYKYILNTIKNLLVAPKDKDTVTQKSGVIYRYKCNRVEWNKEYIGESVWTFGGRFKENPKASSTIVNILTSQAIILV